MSRPIRIAVLHFSHETVTFLENDTTLDDFIYPGSPAKGEALLKFDPKSYMGGFVKMAREFDAVELVGIESPLWPKTYMGSGWVTQEAYETFAGKMIAEIRAQAPFDGVYLCLHGAMAVRGCRVPRLNWRAGCARWSGQWPLSPRPSICTAMRMRNFLNQPTWRLP
jgi:microcystin degradation protein MlrC